MLLWPQQVRNIAQSMCLMWFTFLFACTVCVLTTTTESYLDPTMASFDRSLLHNYPEWEPIVPNFNYHGRNTYAYILERYGKCASAEDPSQKTRDTFDFVTIQLYEGYSHAEYNTTQLRTPAAEYVASWVPAVLRGWAVDFRADAALGYPHVRRVQVQQTQLVVGLSNGWAGDGKFFLMYPEEVSSRV